MQLRSSMVVAAGLLQDDTLVALPGVIDGRRWVGVSTKPVVQIYIASTTPTFTLGNRNFHSSALFMKNIGRLGGCGYKPCLLYK